MAESSGMSSQCQCQHEGSFFNSSYLKAFRLSRLQLGNLARCVLSTEAGTTVSSLLIVVLVAVEASK